MLRHKRVKCACGAEIPILDEQKLNFVKCSYCLRDVLIPAKISSFWLYDTLGEGGMGKVYRAVSDKDEAEYAVKVLPRSKKDDQTFVKDFLREINAAKELGHHNNIVKVVEGGFSNGEHYLATEILEGTRLDHFVEKQFHMTEREAFSIMEQILDAEKYMLSKGFLYRDLKPQNIIVDSNKNIKIFDFGLTMPTEEMKTANSDSDMIEGSPFFMPPERIVGVAEDEYSEIYSMGMLFFYMLAGRTYYTQKELDELVKKHLRAARIISSRPYIKHCREETVQLLDKMIQRDPHGRPRSLIPLERGMDKVRDSLYNVPPVVRFKTTVEAIGKTMKIALGIEKKTQPSSRKFRSACSGILRKAALTVLTFIVLGSVFSIAGGFYKYFDMKDRTRQILAGGLGIPSDIQAPDKPQEEIEKMIVQRERDIIKEKIDVLKPFDSKAKTMEICANLKINAFVIRVPSVTIEKLDKFVAVQKAAYVRRNGNDKGFNGEKYYRDSGYLPVEGQWISQNEMLKFELQKAEKAFNLNHETEMCEIRKSARAQAENEIYSIQGYISYMGKWTPARQLLDELVFMKMKESHPSTLSFKF